MHKYHILTLFFIPMTCFGFTFGNAKTVLADKVYGNKGKTFYCGCDYQKKSIKSKSCGIVTKKHKKRQKRLEWEHVVPAHAFGQSFKQWREHKKFCGKKSKSPRKCARKMNPLFKEMEGDIFNLVPSIGAINALRSNYSFTDGIDKKYEVCPGMKIHNRKVTPPQNIIGDIARIYFYMDETYPGRGVISNSRKKQFLAWHKIDPPDRNECEIYFKKKELAGKQMRLLENSCRKK